LEDYDHWVAHLERLGQRYRCAVHDMRQMSIYVDDPDGYHIELTAVLDPETAHAEVEKRGLASLGYQRGESP
jgi:hypothetical protein